MGDRIGVGVTFVIKECRDEYWKIICWTQDCTWIKLYLELKKKKTESENFTSVYIP